MSSISGNIVKPVEPPKFTQPGGASFNLAPGRVVNTAVEYKSTDTRDLYVTVTIDSQENISNASVTVAGQTSFTLPAGQTVYADVQFTAGQTEGPYVLNYNATAVVVQ